MPLVQRRHLLALPAALALLLLTLPLLLLALLRLRLPPLLRLPFELPRLLFRRRRVLHELGCRLLPRRLR